MNWLKKLENTRSFGKFISAIRALFPAASSTAPDSSLSPIAKPDSVHIAFAGGGWRAHAAHAGWTISLLQNGKKALEDVFTHVGTVSSNSGGSWFSTMLVYSDDFVKAIEAPDAINTWSNAGSNAAGWLGKQQHHFDKAILCDDTLSGNKFLACVFMKYTNGLRNATYWNKVVTDLVFKDYPISESLNGTRQLWAKDKALLLAATMLTNEAVLGQRGFEMYTQYYQACLSPSTPELNGLQGATCGTVGNTPDVTPVTFSSMPDHSTFTSPHFFPALGEQGQLNLGYTENASSSPETQSSTIRNPLRNDHVPVMVAAAASSAAAGFAASHTVLSHHQNNSSWENLLEWEESYAASDAALNFQLEGTIQHLVANGKTVEELAKKKIVQLADGGPVDNSGVAQIVSFLQRNNQATDFNIVAFDNVQDLYMPGGSAANVGTDIAYLFGRGLSHGNQFCSGRNGTGTCVTVPNLQIFELAPLESKPLLTWSAAAPDDNVSGVVHQLIYTKYSVTTVANSTFSITAGSKGTLHAFTCAWSDADTAPQNKTKDGDFKAYAEMFNFIHTGLQKQDMTGKTGLKYLEEALGLKS